MILLLPGSARALGYELSAGAKLGRGQATALQTGAELELALALDPQILVGMRAESGTRRALQGWEPLHRAGLAAAWRFDRTRWMFRLGAATGVEVGPAGGPGLWAGAALGLDHWPTPHRGMAYGLTLGYELDLRSGAERIVLGLHLRVGGEAERRPEPSGRSAP
ncbi:MAG: hypothetical protein P1V51_10560 [Deltaproteobacteria bacterium]|nr:hypothetical protein [Deltaproteobacteria bacterium]